MLELARKRIRALRISSNVNVIVDNITKADGSALDRFRYAEEDMLAMAVTLIDEECLEAEHSYSVNAAQFKEYV
jgi:hypothetical protein